MIITKQFDPQTQLYLDANGNPLSEEEILNKSFEATEETIATIIILALLVSNGNISVDEWSEQVEETIKKEYIRQYTLGVGGKNQLTNEDMAIILGIFLIQRGFLQSFAEKIRNGQYSEAQIKFLMTGYINSGRQAFERGVLKRMQRRSGCPPIVKSLPAFPGDGSTICLSWCKCHWEHHFDNNGCWIGASWILGIADHCNNCVNRALTWNPLIVI